MNSMHSNEPSSDRIMRHPLTGELLHPLGRRDSGQLIWPMMGGSEDAEQEGDTKEKEGSSDEDTDSKDKEGSGNSSETDEKGEKKEKPEPGSVEARLVALEDEKERHYRLRREAEDRADKAEGDLKELREKDLPEVDKLKTNLDSSVKDNESLSGQLKQALLEKAFLEDNTYPWHNPSRALKIADLSRVEYDNDGNVRGLKQALEALAKSDPYLIKSEEKSKEQEEEEEETPPKSGDQKNRSNKDKASSADKERSRLLSKYPGLRR